jgi:2-polyprenyl-6-methoxyphenol hydroxylase-like FAD-dependent oxidoreductase
MHETPVLVAGAGPVGLTLAIDLAWRGIPVTVVEMRHAGEPPAVKCNHTSARSMEIFRRLGLVQAVRNAGLPADWPNDCAWRTTLLGTEIGRLPIPARNERYTAKISPDGDWPTPEPPHRINQIYLEPVMFAHAAAQPNITIFNRMQVEDFVQDDTGVTTHARNLDTGERLTFRSAFLCGCDGGRSEIRKQIGARLSGNPDDGPGRRSAFIRAPGLRERVGQPAWSYLIVNPRQSGSVTAIDGQDLWLVRWPVNDGQEDADRASRDHAIRHLIGVDDGFEYEILAEDSWRDSRLVCDHIRDRRIFLAGDAAHLWPATGGYGMNAGIADAADLAWMLAATLKGWAPYSLLDGYQAERGPVTDQVSRFVKAHSLRSKQHRRTIPPNIEDEGPEGEAVRAAYGKMMTTFNASQYFVGGLNFGYFYADSPIIAYDGEDHPPYTLDIFTPSTVPGCRAPHFWISGHSLYDMLGPDFTLLRFDPSVKVDALLAEAAHRKLPLKVIDVPVNDAPAAYRHNLVLVRPDQHVAWRGDREPSDAAALLALVTGASPAASAEHRKAASAAA